MLYHTYRVYSWPTATICNDGTVDNQSKAMNKYNDATLYTNCYHEITLVKMIGYNNYGVRSELLDIESNYILIINHGGIYTDTKSSVQNSIQI